jgi:hypothetical protein
MIQQLKSFSVPITIAVAFYLFGFFVMANVLTLTSRDVVVGLVAGAVGGATTLAAVLLQERRNRLDRAAAVAPTS